MDAIQILQPCDCYHSPVEIPAPTRTMMFLAGGWPGVDRGPLQPRSAGCSCLMEVGSDASIASLFVGELDPARHTSVLLYQLGYILQRWPCWFCVGKHFLCLGRRTHLWGSGGEEEGSSRGP